MVTYVFCLVLVGCLTAAMPVLGVLTLAGGLAMAWKAGQA